MSSRIIEHTLSDATGTDLVRITIINRLLAALPWLRNGYALSQIIRDRNDYKIYASYAGGKEYVDLMPNGKKGSYAFLYLRANKIKNAGPQYGGLLRSDQIDLDLNLFFNFFSVDSENAESITEVNVFNQVRDALDVLQQPGLTIEYKAYFTDPEVVFHPASLDLVDSKLLRRPYGCISIDLRVTASDLFYCHNENRAN